MGIFDRLAKLLGAIRVGSPDTDTLVSVEVRKVTVDEEVTRAILGATFEEVVLRELCEDAWRVYEKTSGRKTHAPLGEPFARFAMETALREIALQFLTDTGRMPSGWLYVTHSHWRGPLWFNPELAALVRASEEG